MFANKKPLLLALALILLAGLSIGAIRPANAATVYLVNLDAGSPIHTDLTIEATAIQAHGFRVGAIINASSLNPLLNVQGFQFTIHYNATAFAPQGDPNPAAIPGNLGLLYIDGATNDVLFGANANIFQGSSTTATSWNALLTAGSAFRVITVAPGALTVAYSILGAPGVITSVRISAANLLANVNFELINKPSTPQSFTISDVIFVDGSSMLISSVIPGAGVTETVSDIPPVASFTTTHLATGSAACTPVTGVACTAYAFSFDGSTSTDADGTISGTVGTAGFFWDFGDTQTDGFYPFSMFNAGTVTCTNANLVTFTCQGAVAIHDYGILNPSTGAVPAPGNFNVTLRVQDNSGDTGSARDSLGGAVLNGPTLAGCTNVCSQNPQPSHTQALNVRADIPPTASFTPASTTCASPCTVTFNAAASAVGQVGTTMSKYTWNFGDGNTTSVTVNTIFHKFTTTAASQTFTVTLTVTDNLGATGQTTGSVIVSGGVTLRTTSTGVVCGT